MRLGEGENVTRCRNRFKNVIRCEKFRVVEGNCTGTEDCDCSECTNFENFTRQGKKLKVDEGTDSDGDSTRTTFMLKLFDRTVDLGKFAETTPLYSICREWGKNKVKRPRTRGKVDEKNRNENVDGYKLPPPNPVVQHYDVYGNRINGRIPGLLPMDEGERSIWSYIHSYSSEEYDDDDTIPSPTALFQDHQQRWSFVRQEWKKAGLRHEHHFEASISIIEQMYNKQDVQPTLQNLQ